ncbi:MAG: rhodanese-like domain-containing protein [Clostridiales bacterium]|nr:rhodanese-like domain-containing protein [Clostridiales bacterium]
MILFEEISQEKAKKIMDEETDYQVVDVRTQTEYKTGHIVGAICVPNEEINEETAKKYFPDKDQKLLIYCRSGVRSRDAALKLVKMGYTKVLEFGGILDWIYEKEL